MKGNDYYLLDVLRKRLTYSDLKRRIIDHACRLSVNRDGELVGVGHIRSVWRILRGSERWIFDTNTDWPRICAAQHTPVRKSQPGGDDALSMRSTADGPDVVRVRSATAGRYSGADAV
jgi:hypothetical protein